MIDVAVKIWTVLFPVSLVLLASAPAVILSRLIWDDRDEIEEMFRELSEIDMHENPDDGRLDQT